MTRGIYGRSSSASSRSASLTRSLASKLMLRLPNTTGSIGFTLTWSEEATPLGRLYSRLRLSGPRMDETGCTLWPTPTVSSSHRNSGPEYGMGLLEVAWSLDSGRPDSEFDAQTGRDVQLNVEFVLWLMGYPTTWHLSGVRATRSYRSRRPSSSGPTSKL
jgi:hypothetical protein